MTNYSSPTTATGAETRYTWDFFNRLIRVEEHPPQASTAATKTLASGLATEEY